MSKLYFTEKIKRSWDKLHDKRWRAKRKEILARDKNRCVICKGTDRLTVHHKQYHIIKKSGRAQTPWNYEDKYLITLCWSCHRKGHRKFKPPEKYV